MSDERESDAHKGLELFRHKKNRKLYRIVGSCLNKMTDEFALLYKEWDDFTIILRGDLNLFCRDYKDFHDKFEPYDGKIEYVPTMKQFEKDYPGISTKLRRRPMSEISKDIEKNNRRNKK